ncbi:MAG: hypothetical protein U1E48_13025 [Paracoccaceae bacterium]
MAGVGGDWLTGGAGHDDFILHDWLGQPQPETTVIGDYNPHEDQIVVVYDPADHPDPHLSLAPATDGSGDMHVLLDGSRIASVLASPGLTLAELKLLPADPLAPAPPPDAAPPL